jgi:hypothetical protein
VENKRKLGYFVVFVIIALILLSNFSQTVKAEDSNADFSDELRYEPYDSLESLENWYDGVDTFFNDIGGNNPLEWQETESGDSSSAVFNDGTHKNVLRLSKGTTGGVNAKFWMDIQCVNLNSFMFVDFWIKISDNTKGALVYFYDDESHIPIYIAFQSDGKIDVTVSGGHSYTDIISYSSNVWCHISFKFTRTEITALGKYDFLFYVNSVLVESDVGIDIQYNEILYIYVSTTASTSYYIYFDAVGFNDNNGNYAYNQIRNTEYEQFDNFNAIDSNKVVSMRSTLMDQYPSIDNNYRTYLISDKIITDNYIDPNRILRINGTDESQNKYKVMQYYFDNLNETGAFTNITQSTNSSGISEEYITNGTLFHEGSLYEVDNDNYTIESTVNGTYYATYSFGNDVNGGNPTDWTVSELGGTVNVKEKLNNHRKIVELADSSAVNPIHARNTFDSSQTSGNVEFWIRTTDITKSTWIVFFDSSDNEIFYFIIRASKFQYYQSGYKDIMAGISNNVWYHIRIDFDCTTDLVDYYVNQELKKENALFSSVSNNANKISFQTDGASIVNSYFDAVGYSWDENYEIGDNFDLIPSVLNATLESNEIVISNDCFDIELNIVYAGNLTYQFCNISIYNYTANEWLEIDNYDNSSCREISYSIALENITDFMSEFNTFNISVYSYNKTEAFKVDLDCLILNWMYYTDTYSNQSIIARIDSFDSSDLLINKYFVHLDFNKTAGNIYWSALYRESAAVPRWTDTPTNPIFNFEDYMPEGTILSTLQINIHVFLTEHTNQKWIYIRTQVCINDMYAMSYQYDKIIDAGNNDFYDTQSKLLVRYVDYFNENNYTETVYSEYHEPITYTYVWNNLRGYRMLELNSTQMKYNFLNAQYFKTDLEIAPPEPDIPEESEDPIPEPEKPDKPTAPTRYYWEYTAYWFKIDYVDVIAVGWEDDYLDVWEVDSNVLVVDEITLQWYYYPKILSYVENDDLPRFKWKWGIIDVDFTFLRNGLKDFANFFIKIINDVLLFLQYILFFAVTNVMLYASWLVIWLFVSFYNMVAPWFVIVVGSFLWLLMWGITRFIWLWEEIIVPFGTWILTDFVPIMIAIFITVWAFLIAVIATMLSGEEIGGEYYLSVYNTVETTLYEFFEYLFTTITIVVENFDAVLMGIVLYFLFMGMLVFRGWYVKTKGNIARYEELLASFQAYYLPIDLLFRVYDRFKNSVPAA